VKRPSEAEQMIVILVASFVGLWFAYALWFGLGFDF
jgi:hypothetical protein